MSKRIQQNKREALEIMRGERETFSFSASTPRVKRGTEGIMVHAHGIEFMTFYPRENRWLVTADKDAANESVNKILGA